MKRNSKYVGLDVILQEIRSLLPLTFGPAHVALHLYRRQPTSPCAGHGGPDALSRRQQCVG